MLGAWLASCSLAFPVHEVDGVGGAGDAGSASESGTDADADADATTPDAGPPPSNTYAAKVMADAPSLYLRLDETSGPVAVDATGHYDGTYPGTGVRFGAPGPLAGVPSAGITLDGTQGILMPAGLDFSGAAPYSIEVWVNPSGQTDLGFIVDHEDFTRGREGWELLANSQRFYSERWNDGSTPMATAYSDVTFAAGVYHHLVATFDGTEIRLYVDAELHGRSTTPAGALATTSKPWTIGRQNCTCTPSAGFRGTLSELAVYASALTVSQVAAHYHAAGR